MKIATMSFPIQLAIARGAPSRIEGFRLSAMEKKLCASLHISEAEYLVSKKRRMAGGDALSETTLGRKSIERRSDDEDRVSYPSFGGFREAK